MLTELEQKVLDCFIGKLDAEPGFSDVSPNDIANATGIKMNSLRGVLSSLVRKQILSIDDSCGCTILYLEEKFYHLHPRWSKQ